MRDLDFELTWTEGAAPASHVRWVSAVVPGGVHESLLAAGLIEHPYEGLHELDLAWVHDATWWYRSRFTSEGGALRFPCLDGVAEVHLDEQLVLVARNQHRSHVVPVAAGEHELLVRFPPPLEGLLEDEDLQRQVTVIQERHRKIRPQDPPLPDAEVRLRVRRTHLRKATFSWGWDFAPVVTSRGVSAPVCVVQPEPLRDLRVVSRDVDVAQRTATVVVSGSATGPVEVRVGEQRQTAEGSFALSFPLTDVQLWWTHDLGTPHLYDVQVTAGGQTTALRHGVKTLELEHREGLFRFVLNGQPVFARGANWVPPSMLVGSVSEETTRALVQLSVDGRMNMLRVWGGGVLGTDGFYDACDELGVLVWQDFLFACYDYPDPYGHLAAEVELEATEQVIRLRNRTSLAVWCGENEVQGVHEITHGNADPGDWGWTLFNELLPKVVQDHDPETAYWPGSPWSELGFLNGVVDGDRHAWEVWHGNECGAGGPADEDFPSRGHRVHWSRFDHDNGCFLSEFGIHASPERATLERWAGPLELGTPELDHRNKDTPKDKGWAMMELETGAPATLQEYVDFSMACQAEGLKYGIEHFRRRQPHCNGTLVWQLNDSWPGLSWSVIDHDLVPKAGYWFLQRAYAPVLASFRVDGDELELWVTSNALTATDLDLRVEVGDAVHDVRCTAAPYSSQVVWSGSASGAQVAWVTEAHGRVTANRRFLAHLKDLQLSGSVTATVERTSSTTARVRLAAQGFAYLARVMCDRPGARFSTNYLDLRDGQTVTVDVTDLAPGARLSVSSYGQDPQEI